MYLSHYNFTCKPFDLVPNPEFIYLSRTHKKAMTYLEYGIRERAGFVLLTGEVGSGKTTIIRELIDKHLKQGVLAKVFNTMLDKLQAARESLEAEVDADGALAAVKELAAPTACIVKHATPCGFATAGDLATIARTCVSSSRSALMRNDFGEMARTSSSVFAALASSRR